MKAVRFLTVLAFLFGTTIANAQVAKQQRVDLSDILSPEELVQEFGFDPDAPTLFKSSFENPRLQIIIDKARQGSSESAQTLEAYVDGVLVHRFKVSTGKEVPTVTTSGSQTNRRTNVGTFRITWRSRNHVSKTWVGASMPFAQFFDGGIAIHATTPDHYSALGKRDSGGCVRLHPTNAKIMWDLVGAVTKEETIIIVYDGSKTPHPLGPAEEQEPVLPEPVQKESDYPAPNDQQVDPTDSIQQQEPGTMYQYRTLRPSSL